MDYPCLININIYGFRHGMEECSNCKKIICTCLKLMIKCTICNSNFCWSCLAQLKHLDFCLCRICITCLNSQCSLEQHGSVCKKWRNNYKMMLAYYFPIDIVDVISEFLW